jgi:O-antigen/teichoic acid export membrane protein
VVFVVFVWGNVLSEAFFGAEWTTTGLYAKWVILAVFFSFCSVPVSVVIPVVGWNRFYLIFEVVSMVLRISIVVGVAMRFTAHVMVAAIALATCASYLVLIGIVLIRLRGLESEHLSEVDPVSE